MKPHTIATFLLACSGATLACTRSPHGDPAATSAQSGADAEITAFIGKIRTVDNHSHANSVAPGDSDQDALPLEVIFPFEVPVQLRPDNPDWLAAYKALYNYPHADMSDAHMNELRGTMQRIAKEQGDTFPAWVLDQVGTEVLLTNRVAMGPGLAPPRFRWVSYVDALMLPLSTKAEAATSPDREKLFPLEDKLLQRYMSDLGVTKRPATLDAYLKTVVTPTLEAQQRSGCVAVKFEAAFLRSLDFEEVPAATASKIYAKYASAGEPSHADYKALQDFLFRYIAREAGRLGMAVHIHSFNGPGNFYRRGRGRPVATRVVVQRPNAAPDQLRHRPRRGCLRAARGRDAVEAERLPGRVRDDAALHAAEVGPGAEGVAHSVSGEGALRLRRRRLWAGYGLGVGRLDRHQERESSARIGAHRHDPGGRGQPRPGRGDRDDGDAHECREALQAGAEVTRPQDSPARSRLTTACS